MTFIRTCIALLALLSLTYVVFRATAPNGGLGFEGEQSIWSSIPQLAYVGVVASMFLGIAFGCLFRQLQTTSGEIHIGRELGAMARSSSFFSALLVAPIVFGGVYLVIQKSPGDLASLLLAFQNGFFCESVFRKQHRDAVEAEAA